MQQSGQSSAEGCFYRRAEVQPDAPPALACTVLLLEGEAGEASPALGRPEDPAATAAAITVQLPGLGAWVHGFGG